MENENYEQLAEARFLEYCRQIEACNKKVKRTKRIAVISSIAALIAGASGMGVYNSYMSYYRAESLHDKIATVEYVLENEFLHEYDKEEIADYAALGMTLGLNDPYTSYYPKTEFSMLMDDGNGDFVGIGVIVVSNTEENIIEIESVVAGGPAEKAGILPGDILKAVDGEEFTAMEFSQAVAKVRGVDKEDSGKEGEQIVLTLIRDGEEITVNVVREKIHSDSVESKMLEDDIGYLKITGFNTSDGENPDTFTEFKTHFEELQKSGAKKLIIDVRDNGGGDLEMVSGIVDMLIPKGVLMYSQDKKGHKEYLYSDNNEVDMPMAVLVNGNSASASELLTGALKDYEKATVVGTKTFGKGVMQRVYPFSDGSGMVVTVAKYYTPNGTCVQDEGITPDIVIEQDDSEKDVQLEKAMEILK